MTLELSNSIRAVIDHDLAVKFSRRKRNPNVICSEEFRGPRRVFVLEHELEPGEVVNEVLLSNLLYHVIDRLVILGQYPIEAQ